MNIYNNKNYGDNYTVQAGATVVARSGIEEALARERYYDELERRAAEHGQPEENTQPFGYQQWQLKSKEERMKGCFRADEVGEMPGALGQLFWQGSGLSVCLRSCLDETERREVWFTTHGYHQEFPYIPQGFHRFDRFAFRGYHLPRHQPPFGQISQLED